MWIVVAVTTAIAVLVVLSLFPRRRRRDPEPPAIESESSTASLKCTVRDRGAVIGLSLGRRFMVCGALSFPASTLVDGGSSLHEIATSGGEGTALGERVSCATGSGQEIFEKAADAVLNVAKSVRRLESEALPILGIGLAMPGLIDLRRKNLRLSCSGVPAGTAVAEKLATHIMNQAPSQSVELFGINRGEGPEALARRIFIDNDATAMARGYVMEQRVTGHCACLILCDGLGAGLIVAGRLVHGHRLSAGEVGHQTLELRQNIGTYVPEATRGDQELWISWLKARANIPCPCGREGLHWEMLCSVEAVKAAADLIDPRVSPLISRALDTAIQVYSCEDQRAPCDLAAEFGEADGPRMRDVLDRIAMLYSIPLAVGIANLDNVLDLDHVVLSGEVVKLLEPHLQHRVGPIVGRFALQGDATNLIFVERTAHWIWRGAAQLFVDSTYPPDSHDRSRPGRNELAETLYQRLAHN